MTAPFAASLRAQPTTLYVGARDGVRWRVRVEVPEVWDVVRVDASPQTPVEEIKKAAVATLIADAQPEEFVTKLNGIEVLDERVSLADAGALDGSTFLVTFRRRRPVR